MKIASQIKISRSDKRTRKRKGRAKAKYLARKTVASFLINDYVFAQVKGFSPWPAQVTEVRSTCCKVFFFDSADFPM